MTAVPARGLRATPGQTVGPFFAFGLRSAGQHEVVPPGSPGAILLGGSVRDGHGVGVPDAVVEIWGADHDGTVPTAHGVLRREPGAFSGFGRAFTDDEGRWEVWTRIPGSIAGEAPAFAVVVLARGLPDLLRTRIYVPGDERLAADPLLASLSAEERATLIATRLGAGHLTHDIRLQGEGETVFLAR